jgi:Tfp pilus assembly protein PilF
MPTLAGLVLLLAVAGAAQTSGSTVCASCHRAIFDSYRTTPMARSARKLDTATVPERFDHASFTHAGSGFRYRIAVRDSAYFLDFDNATLTGSKRLAYAVGSGVRAFSYLIADDGFLFEAPAAYYTATKTWGLAPGYDGYNYPFVTRPIVPGCLSCHASRLQVEPETLNRYQSPPFLEDGVSCERCHGDGAQHVAGGQHIVNPAKLPAENRDSICAQCHLTGDVRVMRPGSDWRTFQPGGRLSDSQTVFVRSGKAGGMAVTGHVENLALSACKRMSGDRMWCGSCHDPHRVPTTAEAPAWFRARCLTCHAEKDCGATKQARAKAKDCAGCHMPKAPATDAQHVVFTDHSIPRRPQRRVATAASADLVTFDGKPASARDLALAYAIAALGKSDAAAKTRARTLLEQAAKTQPNDREVLVSLAEIYRNDGQGERAQPLYERVLAIDPGELTALVGLGGVLMEHGQYAQAIRLWTAALSKNSGLELVRLNLSLAQWKVGDRTAAEANLRKALELNPAFAPARESLDRIAAGR